MHRNRLIGNACDIKCLVGKFFKLNSCVMQIKRRQLFGANLKSKRFVRHDLYASFSSASTGAWPTTCSK